MAVRMKDIAKDLGVSLMTVSKALRNHSDISAKTRERVLQRMKELGYHPNWIARSLVTKRTYLVGLVLPDLMHSFFAEVAKGVSRKLGPLGYQVVIADTDESADNESRQVRMLLDRKVDGLILASAQRDGNADIFEIFRTQQTPYVLIDRTIAGVDANYVGVKDEDLGFIATEHLIQQGCRRIAHLRGPTVATGAGRLKGYRRALQKYDLPFRPDYVAIGRHEEYSGYEGMKTLLRLRPRPDSVFCYNDPVATGAIHAILDSGLRIPDDVALIGAGNLNYSALLRVPLSTVDQSCGEIGEQAATLLIRCIESTPAQSPETILFSPRLIARDSTRRTTP